MPELPDVEGYRCVLADNAVGREIRGVDVLDRVMLRNSTPRAFEGTLTGRRFESPRRHGKWLLAPADCPRCGAGLRRATVAGRTTYWCPRCQRAPRS